MCQLIILLVPFFDSDANVKGFVLSKLANVAVNLFREFDIKSQKL